MFRTDGPLTVVVPTSDGLGGPCVEVTDVSVGFDWYHGRLLMNTEVPLSRIDPRKYSELRILYLKKVSNYGKVLNGETLVAKYKRKTFTGKNKYECLIWLTEMVEKEL
jgi:hypothetical protein